MPAPTQSARLPRRPLAVLGLAVVVAVAGQASSLLGPTGTTPDPVAALGGDGAPTSDGFADPLDGTPLGAGPADLERIRENVTFWSARALAQPSDFVSNARWATAEIDLARATGDVTRYVAAQEALDRAVASNPEYRPALAARGAVLVALHDFAGARDHARTVLELFPGDPGALATLADAAVALGDMDTARGALQELALVADSAAARVRASHVAFLEGDPAEAVVLSREAVAAAIDEGLEGSALAWYRSQLGDTLASTGDLAGAEKAFTAALGDDPASVLGHWGLGRIAAADGDWDRAIGELDAAIGVVPLPEFVARRADLYALRGAPGDERLERVDRATVLAIGDLAGEAAGVYDRTLSLYLSSQGEEVERALTLAEAELDARQDIYGYDALAWALLANGRAAEARTAMTEALALGTRDARLLFHAGMIEAALGDTAQAQAFLEDALATDPSFDPAAAEIARDTLAGLR